MPKFLKSTTDIRAYFDNNYATVKKMWDSNPSERIVKSDWDIWYKLEKTYNRWDDGVIKVTKAKLDKNGKPLEEY